MNKYEALKLALEALEMSDICADDCKCTRKRAINAIKAALANEALERKAENARELGLDYEPLEAKDEPVAWANMRDDGVTPLMLSISQHPEDRANWMNPVPLYTTPTQRTWVGLTNDEVNDFAAGCHLGNSVQGAIYKAEAKLKEKNT